MKNTIDDNDFKIENEDEFWAEMQSISDYVKCHPQLKEKCFDGRCLVLSPENVKLISKEIKKKGTNLIN